MAQTHVFVICPPRLAPRKRRDLKWKFKRRESGGSASTRRKWTEAKRKSLYDSLATSRKLSTLHVLRGFLNFFGLEFVIVWLYVFKFFLACYFWLFIWALITGTALRYGKTFREHSMKKSVRRKIWDSWPRSHILSHHFYTDSSNNSVDNSSSIRFKNVCTKNLLRLNIHLNAKAKQN